MDHAPGPRKTRAAQRVAKSTYVQGSPGCEEARHKATMAMNAPAMGVHKPRSRNTPATRLSQSKAAGSVGDPRSNLTIA